MQAARSALDALSVKDLFEKLLKKPLTAVPAPDDGRRVIIVDALDECAPQKGRNALLAVIVKHFDELPSWLGLIVTTRPESAIVE